MLSLVCMVGNAVYQEPGEYAMCRAGSFDGFTSVSSRATGRETVITECAGDDPSAFRGRQRTGE